MYFTALTQYWHSPASLRTMSGSGDPPIHVRLAPEIHQSLFVHLIQTLCLLGLAR